MPCGQHWALKAGSPAGPEPEQQPVDWHSLDSFLDIALHTVICINTPAVDMKGAD